MNSQLQPGTVVPFIEPMTRRRLVRAYLKEAKYETLRMVRTPAFAIPFLILPVSLYLLFGVLIFGEAAQKEPAAAAFIFVAFAVFGVMGPGMFGFGMVVAIEREQGLLKLKRVLPMPAGAYLAAKTLMALIFGVIVMTTLILALPLGHLHLTIGRTVAMIGINMLGIFPFCAIGLFIGALTTSRSAPAFVNVIYQVMMHLSGLFYPLPQVLRKLAPVWPTYHLQQLLFTVCGTPSQGSTLVHAGVLIALALVLNALAIRRLARSG